MGAVALRGAGGEPSPPSLTREEERVLFAKGDSRTPINGCLDSPFRSSFDCGEIVALFVGTSLFANRCGARSVNGCIVQDEIDPLRPVVRTIIGAVLTGQF